MIEGGITQIGRLLSYRKEGISIKYYVVHCMYVCRSNVLRKSKSESQNEIDHPIITTAKAKAKAKEFSII